MKIPFLDLNRQHTPIIEELEQVANEVIRGGWFIGGEKVERFELEFAQFLGVAHCVGCGNGTDALELALEVLGVGQGDEVIIPSFTWVSGAEAVVAVGAKPVYVDIKADDYNISIEGIEKKITNRTKAIIAVHLFGLPCEMKPLLELAKWYNLKVIEDCAQAHGASYKGQKVGTIGDIGAFSFYPTKNLGALGDGGALTTHDEVIAKRLRLLRNHGQPQRDVHELVGRNSRLDTVQAAILSLKLKHLMRWNKERKGLAEVYLKGLEGTRIILPSNNPERVFHLFVARLSQRNELIKHLKNAGVETAIHYPHPLHKIEVYSTEDHLPNTEKAADEVLSLPLYPGLREEEVLYVVECIKRFL